MKNNRKHLAIVAVLVAIGTVITYYLLNAVYQLPVAASQEAVQIEPLFDFHFMAISFLFALIMVFLLYSVFVFKRQPDDEDDAPHVHGHAVLEIVWTVLPLIVVIALGIWGTIVLADVTEANQDEMPVKVIGRQWSWAFSYPEYPDLGTTSDLVLPVGRQVRLEMQSDDVIHSFWVPEFRVKQDLLPDTETILRIEPIIEGDYKVRCAEICGFDHANMLSTVSIVSQAEFDQWIADQTVSVADLSPEERGEKWATEYGCVACHSTDGTDMAGPTWLGIFGSEETLQDGETVTVDELYITESIIDPGAQLVEGYQDIMSKDFEERFLAKQAELAEMGIEVEIIEDLIAHIRTLQ
jgi:cytochrome c oxidase subunit 2